jgi:hypothetical protein
MNKLVIEDYYHMTIISERCKLDGTNTSIAMCLNHSMQEDDILKHTNGKCHLYML